MKNILLAFSFLLLHGSCQSQSDTKDTIKETNMIIYKYNKDRFILLDSCLNKVDTILNVASGVSVIDTYARNNKCILIYRNNLLVAFNSFEKKGEKWGSVIGEILLINMNHTLPHEFKIVDENHIRVKDQSTNKTKLYELNYLEKKVSFTETIDK